MPNLSHRHLVTTAAALPALAVPAVADALTHEPDPVFAAIEKERALDAAFIARCYYEDDLKKEGHELTPAPGEYSRTPEMVAVVNASRAARAELAITAATTLAGLVAYLDYVILKTDELDQFFFDGDDETTDYVRSLARAAKQIAREAVQS